MFFCTKPHATGTQQIFCTSFHSSCWLHQITTVHCLTNSAVACWRCCCHCSWSPSSSHDLHCMVFGQASFTDFWEINFGLIVLISFLCHQSGVLSFGLHTSSKPVISSAWHFDLFWQSTRHIKWNDLLFCECSLAWVNKSLREIKKSLSKVSPQAIFGFPWVNIHIVTKIDQSFHLTHRVNCGKWSPVFSQVHWSFVAKWLVKTASKRLTIRDKRGARDCTESVPDKRKRQKTADFGARRVSLVVKAHDVAGSSQIPSLWCFFEKFRRNDRFAGCAQTEWQDPVSQWLISFKVQIWHILIHCYHAHSSQEEPKQQTGCSCIQSEKKTKLKSCWPHRMSILPPSFNLFQMMKSQSSFPLNRKRSHCCCKTECCDHWTWTCALEKISSKKHQLTSDNSSLLHFTTSVSPRQIQVNHLQKYCTEEQITGLENTANQSKVHPRHFPSRDQSCTLEKEQRKSQCAPWPWSTLQHPLLWKHPQKSCHLHSKLDCSRSNRQAEARWDPAQEDLC